jgi:hypothetical protein
VDSIRAGQGTCSNPRPGIVDCRLGNIERGGRAVVEIDVVPQSPGRIRNHAEVDSATADPVRQNNADAERTRVVRGGSSALGEDDADDP